MTIPLVDLGWQHRQIAEEVERGLAEVVASSSFIHGPQVSAFESAFAGFCEVEHCIGVASGTDALEMAVRALGIGPGDVIIVPANTFIATALAVLRAGASVKLVDCDPDTFLIDVSRISKAMEKSVKAIIPVHLFGQTAPMEELRGVADHIQIIEDAAQSQGAQRLGKAAGSLGTIAATSFYPGKNIGAYGDAGAVLTNDADVAQRVRNLGNWGSPRKYHHPQIGFNSRLDTLQAVVLNAKLARLADWNRQRRAAADFYFELLESLPDVVPPVTLEGNEHVWHLFVIRVLARDRVLAQMHNDGVGVGVHYPIPIHLQGALGFLGHRVGDFPASEAAAGEMLSLPIFPGITSDQQVAVVESLTRAIESARS